MPLTWSEMEALASALSGSYPEAEPLDLPATTLRARVTALPDFAGQEATLDRDTLQAVRMLWYELTQAEANDVSG